MTRVDELQQKYPSLPRDFIVKWDVLRNGVKDTDDIDKVSHWGRTGGSYESYDHDMTFEDVAKKRPETVKPGFVKRPGGFLTKSGLGVSLQRYTRSPLEVRDLGDGRWALYEGEEKVEDIFFLSGKEKSEEPVTSKGTPVSSLVANMSAACFFIVPVRHCEYFARGEECKFCNFNPNQDAVRSIGLYRPPTINLEETVEAYKIVCSNTRLVEGRLELGGFANSENEARLHVALMEKIATAAPYTPNVTVHTQPMARKDMQRLKDAGLACITFQMEAWDPDLFPEVCPGKAKYTGRDRYLEGFQEAVDIFGPGNVGCVFVGGVTMVPPNGHKTWQEARASHVEGNHWMVKNGVFPIFTPLRLPPGSVYGADPANQEKRPPTEYYLEVALAHHEDMSEYGLYPKLNKLLECPMDCLFSLYGAELGILALAGNPGTWLADTLPDETNWLTKFVSSVRPPATTR